MDPREGDRSEADLRHGSRCPPLAGEIVVGTRVSRRARQLPKDASGGTDVRFLAIEMWQGLRPGVKEIRAIDRYAARPGVAGRERRPLA